MFREISRRRSLERIECDFDPDARIQYTQRNNGIPKFDNKSFDVDPDVRIRDANIPRFA